MSILIFAGSLRADSVNKKLAREAARFVGAGVELIDLRDFPMPVYDGDIEASQGIPAETTKLGEKIKAAEAIIIATPEYNGGIPGPLKNVIDWISRIKPNPLTDKHLLLLAASPGAFSGVRGLWHSRVPFEAMGTHVFPNMMGLGDAYNAFGEDGKLTDEKKAKQLQGLVESFIKHIG